jgi:hypothetical protein
VWVCLKVIGMDGDETGDKMGKKTWVGDSALRVSVDICRVCQALFLAPHRSSLSLMCAVYIPIISSWYLE